MNFKNLAFCLLVVFVINPLHSQDVDEKQKGHIVIKINIDKTRHR